MPIVVPIVSDTSGLTRGLRGAGSNLAKFGKIAALAIGVGVTAELYKSVKAAAAAEKSTQALRGQLQSLGKSDDVERLQDQFTQLATTLGVDDEAASRAFTSILRLTGDSTKAMEGLNLALDLSANTGFADLEKNAMQVARAMNGNTRLFKQFGITVDENTTKQEALAIVQGRVQGQAESFGTSATGSFQRFNESVENLRENIGGPLVIALAAAAGKVAEFVNKFREQPTLTAKIRLVVGAITDTAGTAYRNLLTWWTTTQKTELPARVIITPSGRQQFEEFFAGVERDAERAGRRAVRLLIGSFTSGGRKELGPALTGIFEKAYSVLEFTHRVSGTTAAVNFIAGFVREIDDSMEAAGRAIVDAIVRGFDAATAGLSGGLQKVVNKAIGRAGPTFRRQFAIIISDPIKEAVASARESLAGLGSSLGDMLSTITGKTSPEAIEAAAIRKRQKKERAAREEKALRDALTNAQTVDEREKAQQDLDDWLLEQEAQRLEESVANQQEANSLAIDNLIEEFNRGLIGPETFSTKLDGIIGANRGTELGIAFAGGFSGALGALTTTVASIVAGAAGVQAPTGTGVAAAQSGVQEEKEARYNEAVREYNARRAERLERAENARRAASSSSGTRIDPGERAEIHRIMAAWDAQPGNQKPQRSAFGLARGGILKQPTFVAGEAGREAVIPLESSSAMKILRDAIGGGGGSTVVYNLVVNAGLGTDPDDLGRVIVESIKRYEKRNGAVFQGPIVTTLANAAGKTSTASAATDFNRAKTLRSG